MSTPTHTRRRPAARGPLTIERLDELARLARPAPPVWSTSDAMAHHAACRAAVAELVAALRPLLAAQPPPAEQAALALGDAVGQGERP